VTDLAAGEWRGAGAEWRRGGGSARGRGMMGAAEVATGNGSAAGSRWCVVGWRRSGAERRGRGCACLRVHQCSIALAPLRRPPAPPPWRSYPLSALPLASFVTSPRHAALGTTRCQAAICADLLARGRSCARVASSRMGSASTDAHGAERAPMHGPPAHGGLCVCCVRRRSPCARRTSSAHRRGLWPAAQASGKKNGPLAPWPRCILWRGRVTCGFCRRRR
jgi:hypothetical protein